MGSGFGHDNYATHQETLLYIASDSVTICTFVLTGLPFECLVKENGVAVAQKSATPLA